MLCLGGREERREQRVSFPGEIKAYMAYQPLAPKLNIVLLPVSNSLQTPDLVRAPSETLQGLGFVPVCLDCHDTLRIGLCHLPL